MTLEQLIEAGETLQQHTTIARRALDRLRAVDQHAQAAMDRLVAEHEPLRRQVGLDPGQGKALLKDLQKERRAERQPAASVALFNLVKGIELETAVRDFIAAARRDATRTWPDELDHVTADGMLTRALLKETMRATRGAELRAAAPGARLAAYRHAIQNKLDPRSRIIGALVEEIAEEGTGATTPAEMPKTKELRDTIEYFQSARVPKEITDLIDTIEAAKKVLTMADRLDVRALNPQHELDAAAAYARELANEDE